MEHCHCGISNAVTLVSSLAFLGFGTASSLHCLGMCAPLSYLIYGGTSATNATRETKRILPLFLYHSGRVLSYAGFGALFAWFGGKLNSYFQWPIVSWLIIICMAVYFFGLRLKLPATVQYFQRLIADWLPRLSRSQRGVLVGLASPLLPCGVLYVALAAASAAPSAALAAGWMALFALGTIPLLALGQIGLQFVNHRLPRRFEWVMKKSMALVSIVFLIYMQLM